MVLPPGISRLARSTSTWIHWWSPVASANLSTMSWVPVSHSDGPSSSPTCWARSFGVSTFSIGSSSGLPARGTCRRSSIEIDQLLERHHLVALGRRRHQDQRLDAGGLPRLDALAHL